MTINESYYLHSEAFEYCVENVSAVEKTDDIGVPKVSLKVEFVPLDQTDEYKNLVLLERVLIGDTVAVSFDKLG